MAMAIFAGDQIRCDRKEKSYCSVLQTNFFKVALLFLRLCFMNYTLFVNDKKSNINIITLACSCIQGLEEWGWRGSESQITG